MMNIYTVAFFGHRYLDNILQIEEQINEIIEKLIKEKKYVEFLVGRNGEFDQCVSSAVIHAQQRYYNDNNFHILILPYLTAEYKNNVDFFNQYYDEIEICQAAAEAHFKSAIQIRNYEMVKRAHLVVCYVEHKSGGAYKAMQYAKRQNKKIINLATEKAEFLY